MCVYENVKRKHWLPLKTNRSCFARSPPLSLARSPSIVQVHKNVQYSECITYVFAAPYSLAYAYELVKVDIIIIYTSTDKGITMFSKMITKEMKMTFLNI